MKYKVGDKVYVVTKPRGHGTHSGQTGVVKRVGRVYGSVSIGDQYALDFHLSTGIGRNPDDRIEVYPSLERYLQIGRERAEHRRLADRIISDSSGRHIIKLAPHVVSQIHAILDQEGVR